MQRKSICLTEGNGSRKLTGGRWRRRGVKTKLMLHPKLKGVIMEDTSWPQTSLRRERKKMCWGFSCWLWFCTDVAVGCMTFILHCCILASWERYCRPAGWDSSKCHDIFRFLYLSPIYHYTTSSEWCFFLPQMKWLCNCKLNLQN